MAITMLIGGVNRWPDIQPDSVQIDQILTQSVDTFSLDVIGEKPTEGEEIILEDDSLDEPRLFAGVVKDSTEVNRVKHKGVRKSIWGLDCDDYTDIAGKYEVTEEYEGKSADYIVKDLLNKYCPGFTGNHIFSGSPIVEWIQFDHIYIPECMKRLCEYVGWDWYIDYHKDVWFFNPLVRQENGPFVLDDSTVNDYALKKPTIKTTNLKNRVFVIGGKMLSDVFPFEIKADGVSRIWTLPHNPHNLSMYIGGVKQEMGVENLDEAGTKDFLMNYQERYVMADLAETPTDGLTIRFEYQYYIDVIEQIDDEESQQHLASIQGGDGVYEITIRDNSLVTLDAAQAAGEAYIRKYGNPEITGEFETLKQGWRGGQMVTINRPDRGLIGTYLVQKVTITFDGLGWRYNVQFGGRLKGIADGLRALVSSQQQKSATRAVLNVVKALPDKVNVTDELTSSTAHSIVCGDPLAVCGFVQCG